MSPAMVHKIDVSDNNKFSRDLWHEVSKSAPGKVDNFLISPSSISTVLAMVCLGAQGNGQKELRKALYMSGEGRCIGAILY